MGIVYLADDPELDRRVALKILRGQDAQASERLYREAQALARVSHPNVIVVYEVGTFEGQLFMAMEFVEGESLTSWLHESRTVPELLATFAQAGRGLAVAHDVGLVHRDFKPDNVLVGRDGRVRVVDFGLACADAVLRASNQVDVDATIGTRDAFRTLTRTGAFMGTPAYMAPEQYDGLPADARTDQFGFCVALYEALYKVRPFEAETLPELARAVKAGAVRPPRGARVPRHVERALLRGLHPRPEDRFASMDTLLAELHASSPKLGMPFMALAAAVLAAVATTYALVARAPTPSSMPPPLPTPTLAQVIEPPLPPTTSAAPLPAPPVVSAPRAPIAGPPRARPRLAATATPAPQATGPLMPTTP